MKRIYKKPETTVVAVAPVKLLNDSPNPPVNPGDNTGEGLSRETVRHTTIPSDDLWEE